MYSNGILASQTLACKRQQIRDSESINRCLPSNARLVESASIRGQRFARFHSPNDVPPVMNHCKSIYLLVVVVLVAPFAGCRQPVTNPGQQQSFFNRPAIFGQRAFGQGQSTGGMFAQQQPLQIQTRTPQEYEAYANLSSQINELNQRVGAFDVDNQQLHTEIAGLQQKLQLANEYNQTLKQQLADTSGQVQQIQMEKVAIEQQYANTQVQMQQLNQRTQFQNDQFNQQRQQFEAQQREQFAQYQNNRPPTRLAGATIRANNSLMSSLNNINIPGGHARMDGDVIRIEFPTDTMFVPGTYQIQPAQAPLLQNIVRTVRQSFPQQIIGVEAHWDGTPLNPPGTTDHQLTATQALAVFNELLRLGLPPDQIFTMAMGSNRPRHPRGNRGGISPNRRIEIVVYPERYDGSK